ncbi:hypothetical protein BCO18175_06189 [Burkholderia contaminans]|nr:hypothetical protein BCO18175_06189 [Burkholderia contaminans]
MTRIARLNFLTISLVFSIILFIAMYGQPTYHEKWSRCIKICKSKGMFGKLEPPHPQYGRNISNNYECRCY